MMIAAVAASLAAFLAGWFVGRYTAWDDMQQTAGDKRQEIVDPPAAEAQKRSQALRNWMDAAGYDE